MPSTSRSSGGRQPNDKGIAIAAREFAVPGKSEEGRRKFVERALQVAAISAEAKEAAIAAGLDSNRSALLEIARGQSPQAQLAMLAKWVQRKSRKRLLKTLRQASSKVPAQASFDIGAHQEAISAVEAAWQAAPELRRALHNAPPPVLQWFVTERLFVGREA